MAFKAYSVIDIFSRMIVGWRVEERECDDLAVEMFEAAFTGHGLPAVVHADSGPAMRSTVLKNLLAGLEIGQTHNRPRVSNDNPFSESEFRTMKYRPNYPGVFEDLNATSIWVSAYVSWYNQHHRHSGIALFTHRGPQRSVDTALDTARPSATGLLRRPPRTVPQPVHIPRVPIPSSRASTSQPKPPPSDSKQLDNARVCPFGRKEWARGGHQVVAAADVHDP